jgi:hypothetical protein
MKLFEELFKIIDPLFSFLANLFAVAFAIHSLWKMIKFSKLKRSNNPNVNINDSVINYTETNNFYGYSEQNFANYRNLTDIEIDNYNYVSKRIWKTLYVITLLIILFYFIQYWIDNPVNLSFQTLEQVETSGQIFAQHIGLSLASSFQKTFNLTWLAQFIISLFVILKMIFTKNILYRVKNILLYSWSIIFMGYLMNLFSKIKWTNSTFFTPSSAPTPLSLDTFKPLFTWYAVLILLAQLFYTAILLDSGIKILSIGELYYPKKEIQYKRITRGKIFILISPIILSVFWYYFKLYILK